MIKRFEILRDTNATAENNFKIMKNNIFPGKKNICLAWKYGFIILNLRIVISLIISGKLSSLINLLSLLFLDILVREDDLQSKTLVSE